MNSILAIHSSLLPLADMFRPQNIGGLMALAGIAMGFGGMIVGAFAAAQKRRLRHELLRTALEKGQPLPPALLEEPVKRAGRDDRRSGIVLIGVSVGLYLFLRLIARGTGVEWVALIPASIGVALLINWALEQRGGDRQNTR